jgi:hypothetical protein
MDEVPDGSGKQRKVTATCTGYRTCRTSYTEQTVSLVFLRGWRASHPSSSEEMHITYIHTVRYSTVHSARTNERRHELFSTLKKCKEANIHTTTGTAFQMEFPVPNQPKKLHTVHRVPICYAVCRMPCHALLCRHALPRASTIPAVSPPTGQTQCR